MHIAVYVSPASTNSTCMSTYTTGTSSNTIFVTADVNTGGLAHTRAAVRTPGPGSTIITSKTSVDATGDIRRADMGTAERCAGNCLVIATEISLSILPQDEREEEYKRLTATYCMEGGTEGQKEFPEPDDKEPSNDFSVVILRKIIHLHA